MMRTPAFHMGSQLLDFLKNGAQFRLFESREELMPLSPLNNDPITQGFYQAILKKKLRLRTYTASNQKCEKVETSRPRPKASHLGRTPGDKKWFCH
jgi:hypothetical protein